MADFVLKNNYFKFNGQIKQQISGTVLHPFLFMDRVETAFLETLELQPLVWFGYINDIFYVLMRGE